ncbi:hypothetical protein BN1263310030 [Stenotrophomonas indicatrix]|nr:hypothetical protein BN1263310030 [Stenotrophomonas indicatrix]
MDPIQQVPGSRGTPRRGTLTAGRAGPSRNDAGSQPSGYPGLRLHCELAIDASPKVFNGLAGRATYALDPDRPLEAGLLAST